VTGESVTLGDVVTPRTAKENPLKSSILEYIGLEHIKSHSGELLATVPSSTMKSASAVVMSGDVMYGRLRPYLNKVHIARDNYLASGEFIVFPPSPMLTPQFLAYLLRSPDFLAFTAMLDTGDRPRVNWNGIKKFAFELPPLDVQQRIVETLEDHLSRLDKALAGASAAEAQVKNAISSFLHELDPTNASAQGWALTSLGQHTEKPQYGWTTSGASSGSSKLLRTTDIIREDLDWNTVPFCADAPAELDKFRLQDGDIVISRTGAGVGSSRLINDPPVDTVFASYLIRVRPKATVLPQFLSLFLKSPGYWRQVSEQKAGSAISNINVPKIQDLKMAIPSVEEQQTLVHRFAEFEEIMLRTRLAIVKVENQSEKLRRSLLHAAFTGQLTSEETND
jgi:type I restriction enzyme S subunit